MTKGPERGLRSLQGSLEATRGEKRGLDQIVPQPPEGSSPTDTRRLDLGLLAGDGLHFGCVTPPSWWCCHSSLGERVCRVVGV